MAFQKLIEDTTAPGKYVKADATIVELLIPTVPLADSAGNLLRGAAHAAAGFFFAKKKYTGNFMD